MNKLVFTLFLLSIFLVFSCRKKSAFEKDPNVSPVEKDKTELVLRERSILWKGTAEYESKVQTLTISPEKAHQIFIEKYTTDSLNRHFIIVDDWYAYTLPRKPRMKLKGVFIHGHTGQAKEMNLNDEVVFGGTRTTHPMPRDISPANTEKKANQ